MEMRKVYREGVPYIHEEDHLTVITRRKMLHDEQIVALEEAVKEKEAAFQEVKRMWHLCLDQIAALKQEEVK